MQGIIPGGRTAAALLLVCLAVGASSAPGLSASQVQVANPGDGSSCSNCGQQQTEQTSGSATSGSAENNPDGSGSQFDLNYNLPDDGQTYSGSLMTQVVNADGSVSVQTWSTSWTAAGGTGYATAWNNAVIPLGGSASISINATAGNGATFSAGYIVKNFGR